ncbi:hypothetical protein IW262DRAFT_756265 [Armillaria fumosa]|nr:hypothetical protein IW262DRAFT_756265 [Armillaria fumosa]
MRNKYPLIITSLCHGPALPLSLSSWYLMPYSQNNIHLLPAVHSRRAKTCVHSVLSYLRNRYFIATIPWHSRHHHISERNTQANMGVYSRYSHQEGFEAAKTLIRGGLYPLLFVATLPISFVSRRRLKPSLGSKFQLTVRINVFDETSWFGMTSSRWEPGSWDL